MEPRPGEGHPAFRVGEVFLGKVIEEIDDRHAVIQIKGHDLFVESHLPLSKNMEAIFQVENINPQVILKLIAEGERGDQQIDSWLKKSLCFDFPSEGLDEKLSCLRKTGSEAIPPQARDTLEHLLTLWNRFSFPPSSSNPNHLREVVSQSGLFFEWKLKQLIETHMKDRCDRMVMEDMKGLLIKLKAQLESAFTPGSHPREDSSTSDEILMALGQILHKIEGYQMLNLHPQESQGKFFLLLPLWFQNHLQFVEMNISLPDSSSDRSESEEVSMLFLLQMPDWGRMSIEVKMKGRGVYCRFHVSHPEISVFLNTAFSELKERLAQLGFQPQLSVSVKTSEEIGQTFLAEMIGETKSLLNIIV